MEPIGLTKTVSNIKLGLVELIPDISAQYLLWRQSHWISSVGLGSKWLTSRESSSSRLVDRELCDIITHQSRSALFGIGLSNFNFYCILFRLSFCLCFVNPVGPTKKLQTLLTLNCTLYTVHYLLYRPELSTPETN